MNEKSYALCFLIFVLFFIENSFQSLMSTYIYLWLFFLFIHFLV